MPLILVPTMFLAVTSGGAARATALPGFPPVDSYFHFALAGSIVQATLLGGLTVGIAVAFDIESGFFDRMVAAPVPRSALVAGRLLGGVLISFAQALFFLTIGFAFGARVEAGIPGVIVVLLLAGLVAAASGGLSIAIALKTRSASVVQGMFPLVFVGVFLSSTFFPRELLTGPARTIADYNPISYIAEGIREPIIIPSMSLSIELLALACAVGLTAVTVTASIWGLRRLVGTA